MALPKAIFDKASPTKNLITTITGLVTLTLSILVALNVITLDQSAALETHVTSLVQAGTAAYLAVMGIISLFSKDPG